ncbi:Lgt Prolipoprotein diacylglyceryltransferase [Burkholderiaceae bacterium]
MLIHPQFDPVALQIGPLAIHWYGLMYLFAFAQFLILGRIRLRQSPYAAMQWTFKDVEDILFWGVLGVIIGGRLGYILFYMPGFYLSNPLSIFKLWEGGMSFHGGLLGVLLALFWFAKRRQLSYFMLTDFVAPLVPLGLAFGRIGNFINGELWGRPSDWPWAMVFPAVDQVARHPSQLYQFAGEGLLLAILLWTYARKLKRLGQISGLFLIGYGALRFMAEFAREPDAFLGLLGLGLSMGQWLSLPMIALGVYLIARPSRS